MNTSYDSEREERIAMEIIVDTYDEIEQFTAWYYYLENTLIFPFTAISCFSINDKYSEN